MTFKSILFPTKYPFPLFKVLNIGKELSKVLFDIIFIAPTILSPSKAAISSPISNPFI